jgi:serine-type D-Ala-D-Ala carboxypeptidase (penicillin-binding protein 5/6)
MKLCTFFQAALILAALAAPACAIESQARHVYLVDAKTGAVLLERNAAEPMLPASMTKMMTVYLAFERLKDGRLKLDTALPVSEQAWKMQGSKMFVHVGDKVRVDDLLRGIIVQSGNDACVVLAQAISGSEAAFAEEMNRKAKELGMTSTDFKNSTGWPDPGHHTTARDLALLAKKTIENFPEYYKLYAETEFSYSNIRQANRNPVLGRVAGADGLKTGHTEEAGYGLTAAAERNGRRLVLVVGGLPSEKERAAESERLLDWGFNEFENYALFKAGELIESAEVWQGRAKEVPLVLENDAVVTMSRAARPNLKVSVQYQAPIRAPIAKGTRVATLVAEAPNAPRVELPLVAGSDVERMGFMGRASSSFKQLLWGNSGN